MDSHQPADSAHFNGDRANASSRPERFATEVVQRLEQTGYQALFAGGCVRDRLLGKTPKDYDVATSATPDQVRSVFGYRHTISVGAAFGVITVIGPKGAGNVEVATFRCDGSYSDGRHPDQVTFSDAQHDALRRDFTINGLFYDPLREKVLDFVGGQSDIEAGVIRAIGAAADRFHEDRLRMLRAVRFATVLNFQIEVHTMQAIQCLAPELLGISGERIAAEMQRLLECKNRGRGLELLQQSRLLAILMPWLEKPAGDGPDFSAISQQLDRQKIGTHPAEVSLAALSIGAALPESPRQWWQGAVWEQVFEKYSRNTQDLVKRWRLSNQSKSVFSAVGKHLPTALDGAQLPWSQLQPAVASPLIEAVLDVGWCLAACGLADRRGLEVCQAWLLQPRDVIDPAPLLTGDQLRELGVTQGPAIGRFLQQIRQQQLDGLFSTPSDAVTWVQRQLD